MSLADPQTVTISGTTVPLPRTKTEGSETEYTSADGMVKLSVSHANNGKRGRSVIRIDHAKLAPDPFQSGENVKTGCAIYTVVDYPCRWVLYGSGALGDLAGLQRPAGRGFERGLHQVPRWRIVVVRGAIRAIPQSRKGYVKGPRSASLDIPRGMMGPSSLST